MRLLLDTAKVDEIKHALELWDMDGVTTNPRHVQDSGKPFLRVIEEIGQLVAGTDKPVSVEVNPHLTDWEKIVEAAVELASISPNFVIKIAAGEHGYRAVRELRARNVRTNLTLVFSVAQAWHAARAGATYVSPFLGWKEQYGEDVNAFIPETLTMLNNYGYPTQIIAAAIRNPRQIVNAALAGAHCVTAGFAVWQDSFKSPFTDMGEAIFASCWDATPKQ
jgi:transaldolase